AAMGLQGLGTLDVYWDGKDSKPVVVARIFNEEGGESMENQETHGCNEDFVTLVPGGTATGWVSGPIEVERFRFNVGVRVVGVSVHLQVYVHNRQGDLVKTVTKDYPAGSLAGQRDGLSGGLRHRRRLLSRDQHLRSGHHLRRDGGQPDEFAER